MYSTKFQQMNSLQYLFYILIHPIDGFQEMKWNNKGSMKLVTLILVTWYLSAIFSRQMTDFVFNTNRLDRLNIFMILATTIVTFLIAITANWCLCTLMDGKGRFVEIFTVGAYALVPYVVITIVTTAMSWFMIKEEGVFLQYLLIIAQIWSFVLIMFGLMVVHDYTFKKTILSMGLTVVGILIIIFLLILAYTLYQQLYSFITNLISEALYRF